MENNKSKQELTIHDNIKKISSKNIFISKNNAKNDNRIINDDEINNILSSIGKNKNNKKNNNNQAFDIGVREISNQQPSVKIEKTNSAGILSTGISRIPVNSNTKNTQIEGGAKNNQKIVVKKTNNDDDNDDVKNTFSKNGYKRPDVTFTDQLSKEQIEEKLEDYTKVDDIYKVPLGVHLRYFSNKDDKLVFRMGGQLHKNNGLPDYVILFNGKAQWSVQVKDTIFYRKMTIQEIKEEYEKIIKDLIEKNKKLKKQLKELQD